MRHGAAGTGSPTSDHVQSHHLQDLIVGAGWQARHVTLNAPVSKLH